MDRPNILASERARAGMNKRQLTRLLGISTERLRKWEDDPRTMPASMLVRLAELFGCTTDYLLGRVDTRLPG